ncbi:MAG: alpha-hydroxy-acid oxidizing protein [Opitutaceae bacterium]|nr:alpha-hydroxy-acid oxidizing protein [Opitutaceae bacterium]
MNRKTFLTALGAGALGSQALKAAVVAPTAALPSRSTGQAQLAELLCLDDVEALAQRQMLASVYDFVAGGAADELTIRWNREKYRDIRLQQRVLSDVSDLDCTTTLLGKRLAMPILLAPTANHRLVHPDGELATARGAGLAGVTMVLSSGSNTSIEEVKQVATEPVWFQLYVSKDRGLARALIQRVEAAGAAALCVTVDSPLDGPRNRQNRAKLVIPPGVGYPHYVGITAPPTVVTLDTVQAQLLDWRDIDWIRSITKMPMLLKGIMSPVDAETGIKAGADGLIVSNHGGRCLDTQPATIEALPRVVQQVSGRVPVIVDGGIRRGTDIVKALALGATAVQIGRPYVYGLAVGGAEGVAHVVKILRQELLLAMALLGRRNIAALDRTVLWDQLT